MDLIYKNELISASTSTVTSLAITFLVSRAFPTTELTWALIAVGFASFFSGFFGRYYAE